MVVQFTNTQTLEYYNSQKFRGSFAVLKENLIQMM